MLTLELQSQYPHATETHKEGIECAKTTLQVHRSIDIIAFFLDISHDISEEDVIRILDACYALRHIKSRMENHPSAILALVYSGSRSFRALETMEQDLSSYNEDLTWKSDFAKSRLSVSPCSIVHA